jgi:hypothetical protein
MIRNAVFKKIFSGQNIVFGISETPLLPNSGQKVNLINVKATKCILTESKIRENT